MHIFRIPRVHRVLVCIWFTRYILIPTPVRLQTKDAPGNHFSAFQWTLCSDSEFWKDTAQVHEEPNSFPSPLKTCSMQTKTSHQNNLHGTSKCCLSIMSTETPKNEFPEHLCFRRTVSGDQQEGLLNHVHGGAHNACIYEEYLIR